MRRILVVCIAVVAVSALALVASGCGSSKKSSGSSGSGSKITKAEFVKKGDAICAKGNHEVQAAAQRQFPHNQKPATAQLLKFARTTILPNVASQVQQLRALPVPPGDESKVRAILDAAQAGVDKAKQNPAILAAKGAGPFARADQLAKAYGLTVCGSG